MGTAALLALCCVLLAATVPVLDEESYLDIASQLQPLRPYDWWRPWQPWGTHHEADAFVFAHPPLHLWWVYLVERATPGLFGIRGLKLVAAAPLALLLGWAVGDLARATTRRPLLAVLTWVSAPVVVLCLQRGLMPDLGLAALSTVAVAAWRRALRGSRPAAVVGGLALAAACWIKYPALALVPVLLVHGRRRTGSLSATLRSTWPFWGAMAVPLSIGEGWLALLYGRLHPVEVLRRAGEISRGAPTTRALGLFARLAFCAVPAALLLRGHRRHLVSGAVIGALAVALAWGPAGLDTGLALRVWPWAAVGGALFIATLASMRAPGADRGPGEPGDTLLLGGWVIAVIAAVFFGHNFAAPRYLLPAVAPLCLLLTRAVDARPAGRHLLAAGVVVGLSASAILTLAEHRFFVAADRLAARIADSWASPGAFTGEWSFRWRMRQEGWSYYGPDTDSGTLVVAPLSSSPGPLPDVKEHVADYSFDRFGPRVVCVPCRVGFYGDTLGVLPVGWSDRPVEEATAWRIR
ncbi:MAG: hypothetical protein D6798_15885 [Deltaproteobacteria bacterium]|nr:MAG: hypothetical protein D6798_15885 [Deltaproteobacteria bacterium]